MNNNSGNIDRQQQILEVLKKAHNEGVLSGIRGRLGELGTIDQKFDIAISTCCPSLNMVVVETIDDANKITKYLRDNKIGVAKCLALDQVNKMFAVKMNDVFNPPENSKRIFDLVKPISEDYKVAFYSVLLNTLVVGDINTANDIAFSGQRHRVVTLNGELFEKTGVISGGGKPKRGLMASKKRKSSAVHSFDDLKKLNDESHRLTKKIGDITHQINEMDKLLYEISQNEASNEALIFKQRYPASKKAIQARTVKYEEELESLKNRLFTLETQEREKQEKLHILIEQ
jgi:structural maintenance of chromosome 4